MKTYWILGHPLSFCLTTPVMNRTFSELKIDAKFETKDLPPEKLEEAIQKLRSGELAGLIPTLPFKTPSIQYLDVASKAVKTINSVNLILPKGKKLYGRNTDWVGAIEALKDKLPSLKGLHVHVIGAGGAARAAAYGCKKEKAKVSIWNRTPEKAKDFAEKIKIEHVEDMRKWDGRPDVIINATAVSSHSKQSSLVPFPLWENVKLAMDAVYGKTSLFLEEAKAANVEHVLSGETWFLKQFVPIFKRITGQKEAPMELITWLIHEAKIIRKA
jgi:shikimate dehydrogenase